MYFTIITVTDLGVAPERSPIGAVVVILLSRCSSAYFVAAFKKNLYYSMRDVSRFFQPQDEDETTNFRSYCSSQGDRLESFLDGRTLRISHTALHRSHSSRHYVDAFE